MNKPHKHAELIKEWKDGAEIEFFSGIDKEWKFASTPQWCEHKQYRIKPKVKELENFIQEHLW